MKSLAERGRANIQASDVLKDAIKSPPVCWNKNMNHPLGPNPITFVGDYWEISSEEGDNGDVLQISHFSGTPGLETLIFFSDGTYSKHKDFIEAVNNGAWKRIEFPKLNIGMQLVPIHDTEFIVTRNNRQVFRGTRKECEALIAKIDNFLDSHTANKQSTVSNSETIPA